MDGRALLHAMLRGKQLTRNAQVVGADLGIGANNVYRALEPLPVAGVLTAARAGRRTRG